MVTGPAWLTPGRARRSSSGAARSEGQSPGGGARAGRRAAEPAKVLREIENVDFSQGRHLRNATGKQRGFRIEKFGLHRDRSRPAVAVAKLVVKIKRLVPD